MASSIFFSRIMEEYGTLEKEKAKSVTTEPKGKGKRAAGPAGHKGITTLMQAEERVTGSVAMSTYANYLRFAGGIVWGPTILLLLIMTQGSQGGARLFLEYRIRADILVQSPITYSLGFGQRKVFPVSRRRNIWPRTLGLVLLLPSSRLPSVFLSGKHSPATQGDTLYSRPFVVFPP